MNLNSWCEVYLIRHGQTKWNVEGKLQGHTDEPLNEEGEKQAFVLREKFEKIRFAAAFSSDLSRANKTAAIVLGQQNVEIQKNPALRERYMGTWEGRFTNDLKSWFNEQEISTGSFSKEEYLSYKWQSDIESYADVYQRLNNLIKTEAISRLGSTILISSHGGVLRALLYHLDFRPDLRWQVYNCAYIKLLVNGAGEITISEYENVKLVKESMINF